MKIQKGDVFVRKLNDGKEMEIQIKECLNKTNFECLVVKNNNVPLDPPENIVATKDTILSWNKVDKIITTYTKKEKIRKRLNSVSLKDVCINILRHENKPMTATEIYKVIQEKELFKFSEKAKTPVNTIHSRIREYMNKNSDSKIKYSTEKGKFIYNK